MNSKLRLWPLLLAAVILGGIGVSLWQFGWGRVSRPPERRVLYYQDSMHPHVKSDQPGKCSICGMDLTPIYAGQTGFAPGNDVVTLSSNNITVLNVQTAEVRRQALNRVLRVAGTLEVDEVRKTIISAPAPGRIVSLEVNYVGGEVQSGQRLLTLYSPELVVKRQYALNARPTSQRESTAGLTWKPLVSDPYANDLIAPQAGTMVERNVFNGQYVVEGEKLLTIIDLSMLWFRFDASERQLSWLAPGQTVDVMVPARPDKVFRAKIAFLEPLLNDATRTVKVRAEMQNPLVESEGRHTRMLLPGMYAEGRVRAELPNVLVIPRTAVLFPGQTAYAYVDKGNGAYEKRRLQLGRQGDELWEVRQGLNEGEHVVSAGNVLLDSQAQFTQLSPAVPSDSDEAAPAEMAMNSDPDPAPMPVSHEMAAPSANAAPAPTQSPPAVPMTAMADATPAVPAPPAAAAPTNALQSPGSVRPSVGPRAGTPYQRYLIGEANQQRRRELIAAGLRQGAKDDSPPATDQLSESQRNALEPFLAAVDALTQALADDRIDRYNQHCGKLPSLLPPLLKEFGPPHGWSALLGVVARTTPRDPAKDLAAGRTQFLPFSAAVVDLVKLARKAGPAFAGQKIYHCPMAPQPGVWVQAKAPLRNPFYGAKMLTCGEEILP